MCFLCKFVVMMKRKHFVLVAVAMALSAQAQINSPQSDGYLSRGLQMWVDRNASGTLDQLGQADVLSPQLEPVTLLWRGLAAAGSGRPQAAELLERYLREYPASPMRAYAMIALADIDFSEKRWAKAFRAYDAVDERSLDADMAEDLIYRRGYCRLMLGDYNEAIADMSRLERSGRYAQSARFYRAYVAYLNDDYATALPLMESVSTVDEPGASAPYYIMQMRFSRREWAKALAMARKLIDRHDADKQFSAEAMRVAGESLYNLDRESEATPYLWKYASMVENPSPSVYYILGVNEYRNGNDDAAIKLLQQVIPTGNALAQSAYLFLGQAYMRRGDIDSAVMAFENAYRMNYDRAVQETAFYNYAVARMDGGRAPFGSSVKILEDFLGEFPDSRYAPEVERYLATGYITDNDYESALQAIERVKNPSHDILAAHQRVLFVMATREYQSGRIAAAESHLRQVQQMGDGYDRQILRQSRLWLGDCLYSRGDYDGAARMYERYLKDAANNDPNRLTALYDLTYARFSAGQYKAALKAATDASKAASHEHPRLRADIDNRIGDCHYYASDFAGAADAYRRAYDMSPQSGDYAIYQLAIVKGLQGDHRAKIADIDRLVKDFPSTGLVPQALLEKAESQAAIGDTKGAIATYNRLVSEHASTASGRNGYLQLALIYLNSGDSKHAAETYKKVISSYPSSDEARLAADDLKRLYASEGRLHDYADFVAGVPDAPQLDAVEMDRLAFEAAEQAYATEGKTALIDKYLKNYPTGVSRAKATYYLAENAWNSGDANKAVSLAAEVVERYPHSEAAPQALLIKGEAEQSLGKYRDALASFKKLEESASGTVALHSARMGVMRCASHLKRDKDVVAIAETLLASSAAPAESLDEARYLRAVSLDRLKRHKDADREWGALAANPATLYGSMSAVALAQSQLDRGLLKDAARTADSFINANPPHSYWLARGFIVYSDILRSRGDKFEADEYLKSLRSNYPGKETDIIDMINKRLSK